MTSEEMDDNEIKIEIQKTLTNINNVTLKVKKELDIINELVIENGQLHTAVKNTNETFSKKLNEMGINIPDLENGDEDITENLSNTATTSEITEKLMLLMGTVTTSEITEKLMSLMGDQNSNH